MDTFAARLDDGWKWWEAAVEEAQEGRWDRDAVERHVIKDIGAATNPLHSGRLAPFAEDSWHVRIGRIANWAGVLRLAARSGGWVLEPVAGRNPPPSAGMAMTASKAPAWAAECAIVRFGPSGNPFSWLSPQRDTLHA
ncbi:hypothetical protein ACIQM0_14640 [Streptomyces sp. NPDC091387]|uniref:hypothetical protein n=1 Tax=Streptomyces sp. NPDC091387 TaxID=3365998 RepID=UPI003828A99F